MATTTTVQAIGVKAVSARQVKSEEEGSARLSPKIALNGSSTGAMMGWLL
jgi:hypothetical protein